MSESCSHPGMGLLLVVDVQQGFMGPSTTHLPAHILRLLKKGDASHVIFTQFRNHPESPYVRFLNWHSLVSEEECRIVPELQPFATKVLQKSVYSAVDDSLLSVVREKGIETVFLCGLDTDCCVMSSAVRLFECGIRAVVLADYCASNGGPESHRAALRALERLIGPQHIIFGECSLAELERRAW